MKQILSAIATCPDGLTPPRGVNAKTDANHQSHNGGGMFYNPRRRHSYLGDLSPNEFEVKYFLESTKKEALTGAIPFCCLDEK